MKILHIVSSLPTKEKPFIKSPVVSQIESLRRNGVSIDILNLDATENILKYITGIFKIRKIIMQEKYDLIHAHYSYCGLCSVFQKRVPLLVSFMGNDLFGVINRNGRQTPGGIFNLITSRILIRLTHTIIVKSRRMSDIINRKNVFIVPNGVDFSKFKPLQKEPIQKDPESPQMKKILFIGNPKSQTKNYPLAMKAVEIVKTEMPQIELLVICGIDQEQVAKYMGSSDLLLHTSLQEGSPNVVKEALACNLRVVSTDVGDVSELINGIKGCYITSYDPEDIARKIKSALNSKGTINSRDKIQHLEINIIAKRIILIYESIIDQKLRQGVSQ